MTPNIKYIIFNGQCLTIDQAQLPIMDHAILYGVSAFETIRVYNRHPFLIQDHLQRLNETLQQLSIVPPFSSQEWENQIQQLLAANALTDAIIRLTITGGVEKWGFPEVYREPNTFLMARPVDEPTPIHYKKLQRITLPKQSLSGIHGKTGNYLNPLLASREIKNPAETEGLMLTADGYVAEGTVSNLFFVREGVLHTPSLSCEIVNGITRRMIMKLARRLQIEVREGLYTVDELREADEIFLTNAAKQVMPITQFADRKWDQFPVALRFLSRYRELTTQLKLIQGLEDLS